MKIMALYINTDKLFEQAQYWTQNRVLMPGNPNQSHVLNDAYAMSEDDREFFWNIYAERALMEVPEELYRVSKKLNMHFNRNTFHINMDTKSALYYIYVDDKFPVQQLLKLVYQYTLQKVLRYWYTLKGLTQEIQIAEAEAQNLSSQIADVTGRSYTGRSERVPYNDGFRIIERDVEKRTEDEIAGQTDINWAGIELLIENAEVVYETDAESGHITDAYIKITVPDGTSSAIFEVDSNGNLILKL